MKQVDKQNNVTHNTNIKRRNDMKRLPIKFEKEVLEPVGIKCIIIAPLTCYQNGFGEDISDYEIAARGLEAIGKTTDTSPYHVLRFDSCNEKNTWILYSVLKAQVIIEDKDFCTCILKAIREIYKDD